MDEPTVGMDSLLRQRFDILYTTCNVAPSLSLGITTVVIKYSSIVVELWQLLSCNVKVSLQCTNVFA